MKHLRNIGSGVKTAVKSLKPPRLVGFAHMDPNTQKPLYYYRDGQGKVWLKHSQFGAYKVPARG